MVTDVHAPTHRSVSRVLPALQTVEGEGFVVRRPFPSVGVDQLDPFLLLDQMGPVHHGPGEAVGTSDHPHRGFETPSAALAVGSPEPGATVRVIAGELFGLVGPGTTHTPISYAHLTLEPGAGAVTAVGPGHTVLVHPLVGSVAVAGTVLEEAHLGVLGPGDRLELRSAGEVDAEVLVLTGRPGGEPIARFGPFVMNSRSELVEAIEDHNGGRYP
jgi:redox-sensitive bicupin YhaK (pirin superfamily)